MRSAAGWRRRRGVEDRELKYRGRPADVSVVATDDFERRELMLNRFRRLFGELMRGQIQRNSFEHWEVEILLDFEACELPSRRRAEILRQYLRAVERQLETSAGPPMLLSHFLVLRERRRAEAESARRSSKGSPVSEEVDGL